MPHRDLQSIIVDNMSNGVCLVRAADSVIVYANPRFNRIYGYEPGELEGQTTAVLRSVEREVSPEVRALLDELRTKGEAEYVIQNRAKDGREIICRARTTAFEHPEHGLVWVAVHEDITEVHSKDAALRASEQRLRTLFESMPVGVFETDARGQCVYVNPSWIRMTGLSLEASLGHGWLKVIRPEHREALIAEWSECVARGAPYSHQVELDAQSGSTVHVEAQARPLHDARGAVIGFLGTLTDVTERVEAEAARREAETTFRQLVEGAPIGVLVHQDGNIRFANAALANLLGRPGPEALVGRSVFDVLIAPADHARVRERMATLNRNQVIPPAEVKVTSATGERVVEARSVPLRFDGAASVAVIIRDMEAQRATLAAKEALLREIHHRVKNNLQVVSSMLRLHAEKADAENARMLFADSEERVRAIAILHERLYRSDDFGAANMTDYLEALVAALSRAHSGPNAPAIEVRASGVHLDVDLAVPCGLIVSELVTNALKHAFVPPRSGATVWVSLVQVGGDIELTVADNGAGLSSTFDWGTARSLGVHLVRTFGRQLRATIDVERTGGTRWVLRFPRLAEE